MKTYVRNPQKGVSLIETLVILAVLAILVAVSIPAFLRLLQSYRVKTGANEIATNLRFARQSTIKQKVAYRMVLRDETDGTKPNTYAIEYNKPGVGFTVVPGLDFKLPTQVKILTASLDGPILFNTFGQANPAGDIILENVNGEKYKIHITLAGGVEVSAT